MIQAHPLKTQPVSSRFLLECWMAVLKHSHHRRHLPFLCKLVNVPFVLAFLCTFHFFSTFPFYCITVSIFSMKPNENNSPLANSCKQHWSMLKDAWNDPFSERNVCCLVSIPHIFPFISVITEQHETQASYLDVRILVNRAACAQLCHSAGWDAPPRIEQPHSLPQTVPPSSHQPGYLHHKITAGPHGLHICK